MFIKILLNVFFLFLILQINDSSAGLFDFYGDGVSIESSDKDREQFSPFSLSCDYGETQTAFVTYHHLKPGYYQVKAIVRAENVQKGNEGQSFWHFYDGGLGTKTVFFDLYGNYGKREITYQVEVKNSDLTVWFRLKSPGKVYVDYFELTPTFFQKQDVKISPPVAFVSEKKILNEPVSNYFDRLRTSLFHFEQIEKGHPFELAKDKQSGGIGVVQAHRYYNFLIDKMSLQDWSGYDRLEFDLYNPNDQYINFNFSIGDEKSLNYWNQLNHNESLAPGWNHISLSLTQYVGERGTVKYLRSLNLKKIKKIFLSIDPESKKQFAINSFYIDNIDLIKDQMPVPPKNVWAFDFTSHKAPPNSFIPVTTQNIFNLERGYGFLNPQFWRVEDSFGPSTYLRFSIGLLSGKFKVIVPNGKYDFQFIIDKLGLWDVPFYKDRTLFVNGRAFYKETRNNGEDYLKDFLRFENTTPLIVDQPYRLYHEQIFKKIEGSVNVLNGQIEFEFSGDPSAISLNTLILWEHKQMSSARHFMQQFNKRNEQEFSWQSRALQLKRPNLANDHLEINAIELTKKLDPFLVHKNLGDHLFLTVGKNEKVSQILQITPLKTNAFLKLKNVVIKNSINEIVKDMTFKISEVVNQFISPGLGHDTYLLNGTYLKELKQRTISMEPGALKYLWIDFQSSLQSQPGNYTAVLEFESKNQAITIQIKLAILPYELPKVEFPVGFLGLDPLPYSYYSGKGLKEIRKKYRFMALKALSDAGFTSFSGLPEVILRDGKKGFELDTQELEETLTEAKRLGFKGPLFSYGGQFPEKLLRPLTYPANMQEEEYYRMISDLLKKFFNRIDSLLDQKIVYLFSDEAAGYSQKILEDYHFGVKIKKNLPTLSLGGFSFYNKDDSHLENLNHLFDYGFYSSISQDEINQIQKLKLKWGYYNAIPNNEDDPRFAFGAGLFLARQKGLNHYLEWNSIGFNQYPYFDFDGRESDVAIFYPSLKEGLYPSVRFELARIGLNTFRKLTLLEKKIQDPGLSPELKKEGIAFFNKLHTTYPFNATKSFLSTKDLQGAIISHELDNLLSKIFINR